MEGRITRSARKHGISAGRIREALSGAEFIRQDGDAILYVGTDSRGLELEMVLVPDYRKLGEYAVIHAMPTKWRK